MPEKTCVICGQTIWGDAAYCRKHYYAMRNSSHADKIKMTISEWETMSDGILRRTTTNAA